MNDELHLKIYGEGNLFNSPACFSSHQLSASVIDSFRDLGSLGRECEMLVWPRLFESTVSEHSHVECFIYFAVESRLQAFEMSESLKNFLGSRITLPPETLDSTTLHIDAYEKSILADLYSGLLLKIKIINPIDISNRWSQWDQSRWDDLVVWAVDQIKEFLVVWKSKPPLTQRARTTLPVLLRQFFSFYDLGDRGGMDKTLFSIKESRELDVINQYLLELMCMDSTLSWREILNYPHLFDLLRGRSSPTILSIVLRALGNFSIPGLLLENPDTSLSIDEVRTRLGSFNFVFNRQIPHSTALGDDELKTWYVGRKVSGFAPNSDVGLESTWLESIEKWGSGDSKPSIPVSTPPGPPADYGTETVDGSEGWINWLDGLGTAHERSLNQLAKSGYDWAVSAEIVDCFIAKLATLQDQDQGQVLRTALPVLLSRELDDVNAVATDQLIDMAETMALTAELFEDKSDISIIHLMARILSERTLRVSLRDSFFESAQKIIVQNLSVSSVFLAIDLIEYLYDSFASAESTVHEIWASVIVPHVLKNKLRFSQEFKNLVQNFSELVLGSRLAELESKDEQEIHDSTAYQNLTIGIYSLDENCLRRVSELVNATYPNIKILTNSDKVATSDLKSMVSASDVIFFASGKAKHAAFFGIKSALDETPIVYPPGNGSSSLLREISSYLRSSLSFTA